MGAFNNPVVIQKQPSQWRGVLPQLLTTAALLKMKSAMAGDVAKAERAFEAEQNRLDRLTKLGAAQITAGKKTAGDKEIDWLINKGVSPEMAGKLRYGHIVPGTDALGNTILIDRVSNRQIPISGGRGVGGQGKGVSIVPDEEKGGFKITPETAKSSTGIESNLKQFFNNTIGQFTEGVPFKQTADARRNVRMYNQELKRIFSNSDRYPVFEQKLVQDFLIDPGRFLTDPDEAVDSLQSVREFAKQKKQANKAAMEAGNISKKQYQTYADQNSDMERILSMIPEKSIQEEGIYNFDQMNRQELGNINVSSLTDEQLDRYLQVVTGLE